MDFYAMQLTPRKKKEEDERRAEQLKKFREHIVTKEEILTEIKPRLEHASETGKKEVCQDITKEEVVKSVSPDFLSPKSFSLPGKDVAGKDGKGKDARNEKQQEILVKKEKKIFKNNYADDVWSLNSAVKKQEEEDEFKTELKIPTEEDVRRVNENFLKAHEKREKGKPANHIPKSIATLNIEVEKPKEIILEPKKTELMKVELPKEEELLPVVQPLKIEPKIDVASLVEKKEEKKIPTQEVGKQEMEKVSGSVAEKIVESFVQAILADDLKKVNAVIEELMVFRAEDPERVNAEHELNIKLKEKLIAAIPALFAYKSGKSVLHVFQLLDELGIRFTNNDLSKLSDEILKSAELKSICEKYLIWFAKEYPDFPGLLQDRIYFFNKCGILSYQEIKGFSGLQLAINSDLIDFIKSNIGDPHDVERKIYEFALAGLVDEKKFKQETKVKDVIRKFIAELIVSKKDKPMEAARKIDEYEKIGMIKAADVLEDDKIEKIIEKYLVKFKRENRDHPRKVTVFVKDYYNAGLINKGMRDKLLS